LTDNRRVTPLTEGAFLGLMTAVMGALAIYFFPVKFLVDFIWGIPLIILVKRYDLRTGLLALVTTFLITLVLAEPVISFLLFIELAPLAIVYAILFKNTDSPGVTLTAGAVVSVVSDILVILGYFYLAGEKLIPTEQVLRTQIDQFMDFYVKMGMDIKQARLFAETALKMTVILIPSTIAVTSVVRAFLTYIVAAGVLRRLNYPVSGLPPFSEWRLPWYSVWLMISGLALSLLGDQYGLTSLAYTGKNMVFIVIPLYFIIGLSVVTYIFKTWKIPRWIKILIIVVLAVNFSGSIVLLTLIGVFDPLVSFRKWRKPKE